MPTSCPWSISHQARIRLELWEDLWQPWGPVKSCHTRFCVPAPQRGETLCAVFLSHRRFIINPLSLSPRQLEHDSNFPCRDADCKGVSGTLLLQMSVPESRTASPSHPAGMGSCRAAWREGSGFAVVTMICRKARGLYKVSRNHNFFSKEQHVST